MVFYFPNVDPVYLYRRSGKDNDEYILLSQNLKIRQNRVILREIPNYQNRVSVRTDKGAYLTEVDINATTITPTEYKVDYTQGVVYFHELLESDYVTVEYLGTGYVNIPAERVLLDRGITADEETLQQFIDNAKDVLSDTLEAYENAEGATGEAIEATQKALQAVQDAQDFIESNIRINKPLVESFEDLSETYPSPENGWTVFVHNEGIRYRWDGTTEEWMAIDSVGGEFPLASETLDGMMSKEDYIKLKNIDENIQSRVISFILPQGIISGVQQPHVVFPYSGFIEEISASVAKAGSVDSLITIEKSADYNNWTPVTGNPVTIKAGSNFNDDTYSIINQEVNAGDIFRLNIPVADIDNLTLNIKINI